MITVNGKTLEVGDKVIFRNNGIGIIKNTENSGEYTLIEFKDDSVSSLLWLNNGHFDDKLDNSILDIIDIEKAPKPEIVIYNRELWFEDGYDGQNNFIANIKFDFVGIS